MVFQWDGEAVVVEFDREASQTRHYCVAKNATRRAARSDPSLRKERWFRMTAWLGDDGVSSRDPVQSVHAFDIGQAFAGEDGFDYWRGAAAGAGFGAGDG